MLGPEAPRHAAAPPAPRHPPPSRPRRAHRGSRTAAPRAGAAADESWWRWGRGELPVQSRRPETATSVSDALLSDGWLPSAGSRPPQLRPLAGFVAGYAALPGDASPLSDASTAHGDEAASTLTLPLTRRGREQTGCCQLLRFAACLTRPDGTSARVPWCSGPVETTHPRTPDALASKSRF